MFSQNTMQLVVNYLVTKPYNEVAHLIQVIAQEDEAIKKAALPSVVEPASEAKPVVEATDPV